MKLDRDELTTARYSAQQVEAVSGLSQTLIQQYCNRKLLQFETVKVGKRTYRRFNYLEVVVAAVTATLRNLGVTPSEVMKFARAAAGQWLLDKYGHISKTIASARFVVLQESYSPVFDRGENTLKYVMGSNVGQFRIGSAPAMGKPCAFIAIDLDEIEREVSARLKQN